MPPGSAASIAHAAAAWRPGVAGTGRGRASVYSPACRTTDGAGSITVTVTPPHSVAFPGVQAAPATPSDGKFPASMVWMNAGETITAAAAVSGLTGTNYDVWIAATRMS